MKILVGQPRRQQLISAVGVAIRLKSFGSPGFRLSGSRDNRCVTHNGHTAIQAISKKRGSRPPFF
jgi:hypothetical protein